MKHLFLIIISFLVFNCQEKDKNKDLMKTNNDNLETLAFEGINIDFRFNSDKPTFGDLFLIVGFENPNFLPNSKEFEKLKKLGFTQVDDYFGIKNETEKGDDVKLWLFPIKNDKVVYHNEGPFDAIRLNFGILRNEIKSSELLKIVFNSFKQNLDVKIFFEEKEINDFEIIEKKLNIITNYCRTELKVEPGSDEAILLDW